jgi:starch phosphorylase
LHSYSDAQARIGQFYRDPAAWSKAAIFNVASSGKFSSDRTIGQYASEIWNVRACPVDDSTKALTAEQEG